MAKKFRPFDPLQSLLVPPSIDDWLPQEHPARFVRDTMEELDLSLIYAAYTEERGGAPPYDPTMMCSTLIYGYMTGTYSSRRIQQALEDSIAYRYLSCDQHPDFRTICDFRRRHQDAFGALFAQVVRLATKQGLVDLRLVAIDGSKMKANASLARNKTLEKLRQEEQDIADFVRDALATAEEQDAQEDQEHGTHNSALGMPADLVDATTRRAKIRRAIAEIESRNVKEDQDHEQHLQNRAAKEKETGKKLRGRKPKGPDKEQQEARKANTTDPESRIMKNQKGFLQGYNAQAGIDSRSGIVVGAYVTNHENDTQELECMLDNVRDNTGSDPEATTADTGYWNPDQVERLGKRTDLFIATAKDHKQRQALKDAPPPRGRIPKNASLRDRMERKLRTKHGKQMYAQRGHLVESGFGDLKHNKRMAWFHLRGQTGANAEWLLMNLGRNLARMFGASTASG